MRLLYTFLVLFLLTPVVLAQPRLERALPAEWRGLTETILSASGSNAGDEFGYAVSLDGDRVVVGARYNTNENGFQAGAAFVFTFDGTDWTEAARLLASDGEQEEFFGWSVALDGDRIVVTAENGDGNAERTGAAYVFDYDGTTWNETAKLFASDGNAFRDDFGWSVALDGDRIAVGALSPPPDEAVYLYDYDGTAWTETGKVVGDGDFDIFGHAVALDGDRLVVGAQYGDGVDFDTGTAHVFEFDGAGWNETVMLFDSDGESGDFYGESVAIDGDRIVVGALGALTGAAFVYDYDGTTWINTAQLTGSDSVAGDGVGSAVAVVEDRIAVGAPFDDDDGAGAGVVFLFDYDGAVWAETKITASDGAAFANFGEAVALTAGRVAAGAPGRRRAYVYELAPAPAPVAVSAQPANPPVTIPPQGGTFTYTVTLTNQTGEPQAFEAWTAVTGPVDREPVVGPRAVTLPAGATLTRTLTQQVPGNAPAGTYTYHVRVGTFGGAVTASDAFPFEKEGTAARGGAAEGSWAVSGWDEAATASVSSPLPEGFALSAARPNPFRGHTQLTLEVSAAQSIRAEVYDALGRRVAVLHDGEIEAGAHALVLDGSALPAGVYVVRVTGETFAATRRATLAR